ncbi:hypothetical protein EJ02DRAFT_437711 [Clathrospora elynae]|uniref:Uncharacterized protein n=1 Tax=Clathrospora elynae TaxID=706981 RepID=A0A6A5SDT2_9PLEO|nr:hypothetical protein EJ02DRAFT_437711 [Clathrospora elynae]
MAFSRTYSRRLTLVTIADITLPSVFVSLAPVRTQKRKPVSENYYEDCVVELTDADELAAAQCQDIAIVKAATYSEYTELLFNADNSDAPAKDLTRVESPLPSADTSDLKLQPTLAVHNPRDPVSQMLDFTLLPVNDQVQKTASSYTPRQARSLTRPPPQTQDPSEQDAEDQCQDEAPPTWRLEHDPVLRHVMRNVFLPGFDDLTNVVARSVFIQYENLSYNVYQATGSTLGIIDISDDDDEITPRPGAFFDKVRRKMANFTALEQLFYPSTAPGGTSRPGAFFGNASRKMVNFTTLDQLLHSPVDSLVSPHAVSEVDIDDNVSDMSDDEFEDSSTAQTSELTYFNADAQQIIAYTAFNQLSQVGKDKILPHIHQDYDNGDLDSDIEITETFDQYSEENAIVSPLQVDPALANFEFGFDRFPPSRVMSEPALPQPAPRHPSTLHSKDSLEFTGQPEHVIPLPIRRTDFLDDEDGEYDCSPPVTPARSSFDGMFSNAIWHIMPDISLTDPTLVSAAHFPDPASLGVLEVEINGLLAFMFDCNNNRRSDELPGVSHDRLLGVGRNRR